MQYYSTWLDCAKGATPEPPLPPFFLMPTTIEDIEKSTDSDDYQNTKDSNTESYASKSTKWRQTLGKTSEILTIDV